MLVLTGCAHAFSLFETPAPANDTERQLLNLMTTYQFNLAGSMRSIDNLVRGFSISFMLASLVMGALGLTLRGERTGLLMKVAIVYTTWLAAMTAVSLRYFFVAPTSLLAAALLIFAAAWITLAAEERTDR